MEKEDIKHLLDKIDFDMPLYFIEIDWKANKYKLKEVHEWYMVVHNTGNIYFGYSDNDPYEIGRTVFADIDLARKQVDTLNGGKKD